MKIDTNLIIKIVLIITVQTYLTNGQDADAAANSEVEENLLPRLVEALNKRDPGKFSDTFKKIDKDYPSLLEDTMQKAVNQVYDKLTARILVNFFVGHIHKNQRIYAYWAIYNEMKKRNEIDRLTIALAYELDKALYKCCGNSKATELGNRLKADLPESIRNLVFSGRVCIKNVDRNEYIYAVVDNLKYDENRRRIYSWIPGTKDDQSIWRISRQIEPVFQQVSYLIKSEQFTNEYMYAANDNLKIDETRRNVFTYLPGLYDDQSHWLFEPSGDNVYIKSRKFGEYLVADSKTYDDNRRYVFTWAGKEKPEYSLWVIEKC